MKTNEIQMKRAVKAGNSSAVILPRAWLNKEVRVELIEKTPQKILSDVLGILNEYLELNDIIGIYLTGSYARGEETENSDIDILVITKNVDKRTIYNGMYSIFVISSELLRQKLKFDLFPIGQMIKEAKPLLNSAYLESIEINICQENAKWYLKTTEEKLKLIKQLIEWANKHNKKYLSDRIVYTLILRIRTMHIIDCLLKKEQYSRKEFVKLIEKIAYGKDSYKKYLRIKNNLEDRNTAKIEEIRSLHEYLKKKYLEVKDKINEL